MTDLELTKLCAEAMGYPPPNDDFSYEDDEGSVRWYTPLIDDAQAMALVKKLDLRIGQSFKSVSKRVYAYTPAESDDPEYSYAENWDADLNRAICECVAKMQAAKAT